MMDHAVLGAGLFVGKVEENPPNLWLECCCYWMVCCVVLTTRTRWVPDSLRPYWWCADYYLRFKLLLPTLLCTKMGLYMCAATPDWFEAPRGTLIELVTVTLVALWREGGCEPEVRASLRGMGGGFLAATDYCFCYYSYFINQNL